MPKYRFNVQDGVEYADPAGVVLADDAAALAEGARVAREVKSSYRPEEHDWQVQIKNGKRTVAEIPFKSVD